MTTPFFSVIMGAYNCEETIGSSINSLLTQSYADFEVIVVNDGSSDSTLRILRDMAADDSRLVVIDQENIGLTRSLNRAIDVSRGKYLVRHDADDISLPGRLAAIYAEIDRAGADLIFSLAYEVVNERRRIIPERKYLASGRILRNLRFGNFIVHGTLAFKKECGSYDPDWRYAQDYELLLRLISHGASVSCISEPLYEFHKHSGSISAKKGDVQTALARRAALKYLGTDIYIVAQYKGIRIFLAKIIRELMLKL